MRGCRKGIAYDLDLGVAPDNAIGFGDPHQEAYWLGRLSRLAQNRPAENYIQIERPPKGRPLGGIFFGLLVGGGHEQNCQNKQTRAIFFVQINE